MPSFVVEQSLGPGFQGDVVIPLWSFAVETPPADEPGFGPDPSISGIPAGLPLGSLSLRGLTHAPLPVVVFSSLANLYVPDFSDRCRIVIAEEGLGGFLIERPMPTKGSSWIGSGLGPRLVRCDERSGQLITANTVRTPFVGPVIRGELRYHGVVMHLWAGGDRPSTVDAALARAAVAHAVDLIHEQRLAAQIEDRDDDATFGPVPARLRIVRDVK